MTLTEQKIELLNGLTERQKRFVIAYQGDAYGNAAEAARMAGYEGKPENVARIGSALACSPKIAGILSRITEERYSASRQRRRFFADMMDDPKVSHRDRIRAGEILCKMHGDFSDTINNFAVIANTDAATLEAMVKKMLQQSTKNQPEVWEGQLADGL